MGEKSNHQILMVLLDWEKAFDKVTRQGLFSAIKRIGVPHKMQKVLQSLYKDTQFRVEADGQVSSWKTQETGIRQGCPLSPYLFLIVMTVMFTDIHEGDRQNLIRHRIVGTTYDEVLYADDTICISEDTRAMNKLIASIETEGSKYGLKLNKTKCELVVTGKTTPNVHFQNKDRIKQLEEVKYLGCYINPKNDTQKEIKHKIATCMGTLKKLDKFWLHSDCPTRFKLQIQDAVIRSKLLYGLESAELNEAEVQKLDVFQLKGLRKILRKDTTYVNRANTNKVLYEEANRHMNKDANNTKIIQAYSEVYHKRKLEMYVQILNSPDDDPVKQTTMDVDTLASRSTSKRRPGRPKRDWTIETAKLFWTRNQNVLPQHLKGQDLDLANAEHRQAIRTAAARNNP
jgi:hypothetical protein